MWLGNPLVYAVYWSPLEAIHALLELGADAAYEADDGFPPLIAATDRRAHNGVDDRIDVMRLLLEHGADPNMRGLNDGAALHQVVWKREGWPDHLDAVRVLLAHGADAHMKTRIDDNASPLEDAEAAGAAALAELLNGLR